MYIGNTNQDGHTSLLSRPQTSEENVYLLVGVRVFFLFSSSSLFRNNEMKDYRQDTAIFWRCIICTYVSYLGLLRRRWRFGYLINNLKEWPPSCTVLGRRFLLKPCFTLYSGNNIMCCIHQ